MDSFLKKVDCIFLLDNMSKNKNTKKYMYIVKTSAEEIGVNDSRFCFLFHYEKL